MEVTLTRRCRKCGNGDDDKFEWRGTSDRGGKRFRCKKCGTWGSTDSQENRDYSFTNNGEFAEVNIETPKRIRDEKDLIEALDLDTDIWEIQKFTVGKSEGYRKDRQVEWEVKDGIVISGEVHDSGKLLIEPLFSVKVWLRRKTQEIRTRLAVADIKEDLGKFAYKYKKINYPKLKDGMLFELAVYDIHLGKLTWNEESGENSDLKTQTQRVLDALDDLLSYARHYPIERILLPIGNDFYNTDTPTDTTTGGTPQQEDTRWQKTYRAGRILAVEMIDRCSQVAPVDVIQVSGNHDETRSFYLGDALEAWYHNNPNVHIDNSAKGRKYYPYGNSLIGFTHGGNEKLATLSSLMLIEAPELCAKAKFREWHCGHFHHKEDIFLKAKEELGVTVRYLRSLSPPDAWHYDKGFVGALQASEAFLWSKDRGVVAQFTSVAKRTPD